MDRVRRECGGVWSEDDRVSSRTYKEFTAEARLAAVARELIVRMANCTCCASRMAPGKPDYADLRVALAPYVKVELLKARISEARTCGNVDRARLLNAELMTAYLEVKKLEAVSK